MKKLTALIISLSTLASACVSYIEPYHGSDSEQKKQQKPVDRNRNSVPDSLERNAVPKGPVIDRS